MTTTTEHDPTGDTVDIDDIRSTAASYRRNWAILTGRPESDIYVPRALRDPDDA